MSTGTQNDPDYVEAPVNYFEYSTVCTSRLQAYRFVLAIRRSIG